MSDNIDKIDQQIDLLKHKKNKEEQLDQGDIVFEDSKVFDSAIKKDTTKKVYRIEDLVNKKESEEKIMENDNTSSISKNQSKSDNFVIYYVIILLLVVLIIIMSILFLI